MNTQRVSAWGNSLGIRLPFEVVLPDRLKTHGVVLTDQLRALDCGAHKARFVEVSTPSLVDEVLGQLGTLVA